MSLPKRLPKDQMETTWASQIDPVLANLLVQGTLLKDVRLNNGSTMINHKLGRAPVGWFLSAPKGAAAVFQFATQTNPTLQLTLISNASIMTDLWVF